MIAPVLAGLDLLLLGIASGMKLRGTMRCIDPTLYFTMPDYSEENCQVQVI
jgi:hypothetical protein